MVLVEVGEVEVEACLLEVGVEVEVEVSSMVVGVVAAEVVGQPAMVANELEVEEQTVEAVSR